MDESVVLDVTFLTMVVAPLLPVLVGLITKQVASGGVKAVLLLFVSGVTGVVNQAIQNEGLVTKEALAATIVAFVIAVATHYGLLKPNSVTGSEGVVQTKTAGIGLG